MANPSHSIQSAPVRLHGLDVLRGVAILLVLGAHARVLPRPGELGHAVCSEWQRAGWMGVELFFALSGFLITGLLLRERQATGHVDAKSFVVRRLFKIYPPALLFVLVFGVWLYFGHTGSAATRLGTVAATLWPMLIHLQNYWPIPAAEHLWSLAVEEHFYALVLVAFLGTAKVTSWRVPRRLLIMLAVMVAASWCGRIAHVLYFYAGSGPIGFAFTHNRIDALAAGTLAACLAHCHGERLRSLRAIRLLLPLTAILTVAPSFLCEITAHRVFFFLAVLPVQAFGLACLVLWVSLAASGKNKSCSEPCSEPRTQRTRGVSGSQPLTPRVRCVRGSDDKPFFPAGLTVCPGSPVLKAPGRMLAFVGRSSYSTYLWHLPFAPALATALQRLGVAELLPAASLVHFVMYCGVALALGSVGYFGVECPALWVRKKWFTAGQNDVATPNSQHNLQVAA